MDRYLLSKKANSVIRAALIAVVLVSGTVHPSPAWAQLPAFAIFFEKAKKLTEQRKFSEAIHFAEQAEERARNELGNTNGTYGLYLAFLGKLYGLVGRLDKAEKTIKRSLRIIENTYGDDHQATAFAMVFLASVNAGLGRYADAESLSKQALAIFQNIF